MKTTIFYYSATGNSLKLAQDIAKGIGGAELLPLAKYRSAGIKPDCERLGFVFPIFAWGPPKSVDEFVAKLDPSAARYAFAVASCGGTAGGTLQKLRRALRSRGGDLNAGFIVRSASYMDADPNGDKGQAAMIDFVRRSSGRLFPAEADRLPEIIKTVAACESSKLDTHALVGRLIGDFFHGKAAASFANMDRGYKVAPECTSCGICAKVCPRQNIALETGKPAWHHDCEFCGACATWCPEGAIGFTGKASPGKRHNPAASAAQFMIN